MRSEITDIDASNFREMGKLYMVGLDICCKASCELQLDHVTVLPRFYVQRFPGSSCGITIHDGTASIW